MGTPAPDLDDPTARALTAWSAGVRERATAALASGAVLLVMGVPLALQEYQIGVALAALGGLVFQAGLIALLIGAPLQCASDDGPGRK